MHNQLLSTQQSVPQSNTLIPLQDLRYLPVNLLQLIVRFPEHLVAKPTIDMVVTFCLIIRIPSHESRTQSFAVAISKNPAQLLINLLDLSYNIIELFNSLHRIKFFRRRQVQPK